MQSKDIWPGRGQHILAQYDEDSIVVYQAFNKGLNSITPDIAQYAVENQKFLGCPLYNETRMTWIKTNFLWMMFRSNWGHSHNQTHILAIWLKREAFEVYLENAREKGSVRGFQGSRFLLKQRDYSVAVGSRSSSEWPPPSRPSSRSTWNEERPLLW